MSSQLQPVTLALWTEAVGVFYKLFSDNFYIYVKIGNKLLYFPKESIESNIARDELRHELIGRKIGLLCTDERTKPLHVRLI